MPCYEKAGRCGLRRGGQSLQDLTLPKYIPRKDRDELLRLLYATRTKRIQQLDKASGGDGSSDKDPRPRRLLTHPGVGSSHRLGDGSSFVADPHRFALAANQSGQLYRDDPVRAQQRQKAATRKVKQRKEIRCFDIYLDRSDTACSGWQGPRTEAFPIGGKLVQKGMGKARVATALQAGDSVMTGSCCGMRLTTKKSSALAGKVAAEGETHAGRMPDYNSGPARASDRVN